MRQTYHFCISSHDEVMFRSESDLIRGFNCFALAVLETESRALADGHLTTHLHGCAQSDDIDELIRRDRYSYTRYFNYKYHRKGPLGEAKPCLTELIGPKRTVTAVSYVNRQGLHHGLSASPFGYSHCSANAIFRKELGKSWIQPTLRVSQRAKYLPWDKQLKQVYRMTTDGQLFREDIIDVEYVEELYITPRNFLYQMNRFSNENWRLEQSDEGGGTPPVTLEMIENGVADFDLQAMLTNEKGWVDRNRMTDLEMCEFIDSEYLPEHFKGVRSIYQLSESQRRSMGNTIYRMSSTVAPGICSLKGRTFTISQLMRCAVIKK